LPLRRAPVKDRRRRYEFIPDLPDRRGQRKTASSGGGTSGARFYFPDGQSKKTRLYRGYILRRYRPFFAKRSKPNSDRNYYLRLEPSRRIGIR
jgi:hypothetical protein